MTLLRHLQVLSSFFKKLSILCLCRGREKGKVMESQGHLNCGRPLLAARNGCDHASPKKRNVCLRFLFWFLDSTVVINLWDASQNWVVVLI